MRKTKIICTLGPASETADVIEELIKGGMDVARLNFSHGTHADHGEKIRTVRNLSEKIGKPVAVLQDLAGPKLRIGEVPEAGIELFPGDRFVLTTEEKVGSGEGVSVSYDRLVEDVRLGDRILLADGLLELTVVDKKPKEVICRVITGGVLTSHKGINLPTGTVSMPVLTEKDRLDLAFGLEEDVDFVAVSFVRSPADVKEIKDFIAARGKEVPVIAKIEKHEALEHLEEIIDISDGVMVARGDLGVEIPLEDVPLVQKRIIAAANARGKIVITATQMLRSMVNSPRPTRAEATDVANAVIDGTDAVMLSEETASGAYPIEAVQFMDRICRAAEEGLTYDYYQKMTPARDVSQSVAHAACVLADHLKAKVILAYTYSGATARYISRFRPRQPIIALSPEKKTVTRLALTWGCYPQLAMSPRDTDDLIEKAAHSVLASRKLSPGDVIVLTLGHPIWKSGTTNTLQVKVVSSSAGHPFDDPGFD
ncbi:MAG TPA: pyruvate kinase [Syntrophales bacterium]|mgnify:CR=1 FL=1|nr:pyruvate kinase [Syntrophales bacterium]HOL59730.1 pyruvate kinase [Syntrophales bacterium]HPO35876.1 pyruvate kinase [Syntrophales bacterium]